MAATRPPIQLVRGDTRPEIQITLTEETSGTPVDLTHATVTLHFRRQGTTQVLFSRLALVDVGGADKGQAVIRWEAGDLDLNPGMYEGEIECVFSQSQQRHTVYETLTFTLRGDFA